MSDQENVTSHRPIFRFRDTAVIHLDEAEPGVMPADVGAEAAAGMVGRSTASPAGRRLQRKRGLFARASDQEWSASALLLLLDVVGWFVIYGFTTLARGPVALFVAVCFPGDRSASSNGDRDGAFHGWRLRPEHGDTQPGLCDRAPARDHRCGGYQRGGDLFGGDLRSVDEAEPQCRAGELHHFPAGLARISALAARPGGRDDRGARLSRDRERGAGAAIL